MGMKTSDTTYTVRTLRDEEMSFDPEQLPRDGSHEAWHDLTHVFMGLAPGPLLSWSELSCIPCKLSA